MSMKGRSTANTATRAIATATAARAATATPSTTAVLWFRNDLRVTDNEALQRAMQLCSRGSSNNGRLLCVYCFDPRHYAKHCEKQIDSGSGRNTDRDRDPSLYSPSKTGPFRAQFLLESVRCLREELKEKFGLQLIVALGEPEVVIPKLLTRVSTPSLSSAAEASPTACVVLVQAEVTHEEKQFEIAVERAIGPNHILQRIHGGASLFHPDDLPFRSDLSDMPDIFTSFRLKVEAACAVRPLVIIPHKALPTECIDLHNLALEEHVGFSFLPTMEQLGFTTEDIDKVTTGLDNRSVLRFEGGEIAGKRRVQEWMFRDGRLQSYFDTRNGMIGEAYSSKLSPWLSAGCLSPRWIFTEIKRYESTTGISNKSTYWLVFELLCRDYFRFFCARHGNSVFYRSGPARKPVIWKEDHDLVRRWKLGQTGVPLVDANMRELLATGWMSNRGRQNVASFLVLDHGIDWRIGADHFEYYLLDHDVCSNYGNWNAAAGLTVGRTNKFNITKQSKDYDSNGDYIRLWVPELAKLPAPQIFEPWKFSAAELKHLGVEDYPFPTPVAAAIPIHAAVDRVAAKTANHHSERSRRKSKN